MTAEARAVTGPQESERQFQRAVVDLAVRYGWMVAHFGDSRREVVDRRTGERKLIGDRQASGYPDLTLVRDGRLILAELKSQDGRVRPEQERWLFQLSQLEETCGEYVEVHVWRPRDWPQIENALKRRFA
jgi:hypothetical protein